MAELGTMRIPDTTVAVPLAQAGTCPVCLSKVTEAEAAMTVKAVPGERHDNVIDMHVSVASAVLTALPCGHVIHEQEKDDDA